MKKIDATPEFMEKNFNRTIELINDAVKSDRKENILKFFESFKERYATCPATQKREYYSAFPGGLCFHNLHVLQWIGRFSFLMAPNEFSNETLLLVSLFHEIGKMGTEDQEYFIPQSSDWHRKQGMLYEINPDIGFVKIPQRSLMLLQGASIKLDKEEYMAILLHEGQNDETNRHYAHKENKLATILHFADSWAIKQEREYDYL